MNKKKDIVKLYNDIYLKKPSFKDDSELYTLVLKQDNSNLTDYEYKRIVNYIIKKTNTYIVYDKINKIGAIDIIELNLSNIEIYTKNYLQLRVDLRLLNDYKNLYDFYDIEYQTIQSLYPSTNVYQIKVLLKNQINEIFEIKKHNFEIIPIQNIPEYKDADKQVFELFGRIQEFSPTTAST